MRIEYIKSFIAVVNYKSFSNAARKLFISQPTISTHIKHLEEELGVTLLVRSTKELVLSEEGMLFYPYAVKIVEAEKEAIAQLRGERESLEKEVTLSTSSVPSNYIMPYFVSYAREHYPEISYRIQGGDSEKVIYDILHFNAELGIGSLYCSNEKCNCEPLFEDEIVLITPNTEYYREFKGEFPIELLKEESFVVREKGSGTKAITQRLEKELSLDEHLMNVAAQVGSAEMVRRSVEAGVGVGFISRLAIKGSVERGEVLEFQMKRTSAQRQIYLIYQKDHKLSAAARKTIKLLRDFTQTIH